MTSKGTTQSKKSEIELLRARLAELEGEEVEYSAEIPTERPIQQDEYISVMSLIPFNLNLSTREGGQGNVKRFTKFGEVKRILYKDLIDIMDVHHNFMENGFFYILHPGFIRQHGLDDTYSKILTKEKIDEILSTKSEDCVALYTSANAKQQEIIVQMLITKMKEDPDSVNLNVIDRISRLSKINISEKASEKSAVEEAAEKAEN